MLEPAEKRVYAFFDGQNLFGTARTAFGYSYPNYDPIALAKAVCAGRVDEGWRLDGIHFYTGIHDQRRDRRWYEFWSRKLQAMGTRGVSVFTRPLQYIEVPLPDGSVYSKPREKGIDVRIALEIVRLGFEAVYDVALIFSQDQDLSEAVSDLRLIARSQGRWLKVASAFPVSTGTSFRRGIDKTDWIPMDKALYDSCLDPGDYSRS